MYTIEINFKSRTVFHSGVATLKAAKNLAEKICYFSGRRRDCRKK